MSASLGTNRRPLRCIVKLGGAAVTVKDELETLNEEILYLTAQQLRDAAGLSPDEGLSMDWSRRHGADESLLLPDNYSPNASLDMKGFVVVHGAGSFGHFQASRAKVNQGRLGTPFVNAGFVATRISVTRLNLEIVRAFASEGIPAVGISPFSAGWSTKNKTVELENSEGVEKVLNAGFLPVLHGDAVLDSAQGCAILSGDVIVRQLAHTLMPNYVVFLTNVPGVFDRPPSEPQAVLLKEIAIEDGSWTIVDPASHAAKVETNVAAHDTTGGMATKIAEAASIAAHGIDVLIVQAGSSHALQALKGTPIDNRGNWVGTIIRKARPGEIAK
ncbi:unnamed protein product [Calypogeia fissa]